MRPIIKALAFAALIVVFVLRVATKWIADAIQIVALASICVNLLIIEAADLVGGISKKLQKVLERLWSHVGGNR